MAVIERVRGGARAGQVFGALLRRYKELFAVVAAIAVLAVLFPSRGAVLSSGGGLTAAAPGQQAAAPGTVGASGVPGATGPGGGGFGAGVPGAVAGPAGVGPSAAAVLGDTTHCVRGREFDPSIAYFAPPCVPGRPGELFPNNGGATSMGVGGGTIELVDYVTEYGAELDQILKAQGSLVTYDDSLKLDKAWENFINSHFVLYGRKVHIDTWQGKAQYNNDQTVIPEMDQIVQTLHPYAVFWSTSVCTECFAELARLGVIAFGGLGFSDAFANDLAPFYYSATESSTRIETAFAQWWCNQMSSVNVPSRVVKWAGTQNPAQNFNGKPRVLGIISPNPPDNEDTIKNYLVPLLHSLCGENVNHFYFYSQDVNTAAQQVAAGIAAMDTTNNPATDVLCICDIVAPAFLFEGEQNNNYYPENVLADVQGMGRDVVAQGQFEDSPPGTATLGCPTPSKGCEYDLAMGLIEDAPQKPDNQAEGYKIFKLGTPGADPPSTISSSELTLHAINWVMLASLMENAGAQLTPRLMQSRAPYLGAVGGGSSGLALLEFSKDNWQWTQDARIAYYDKHKPSSANGQPGTYVSVEGSRFNLGQYPVLPDGPPVPVDGRH